MADRPPSPFQVKRAIDALDEARAALLAIGPEMEQDHALWHDMLEGESGSAFDALDQIIRARIDADRLGNDAKRRKAEVAERQARYERKKERLGFLVQAIMTACGLRKHERGDFTVSIGAPGRAPVVITDANKLPPDCVRIIREPRVTEIGDRLRAGETIPGAELGNSQPRLIVKAT